MLVGRRGVKGSLKFERDVQQNFLELVNGKSLRSKDLVNCDRASWRT